MVGKVQQETDALDDALRAIAHKFRRRILFALIEEGTSAGRNDPLQYGNVVESFDPTFEIQLHHNHLPRLEEQEYIGWDREEKTVKRGSRWRELEPLLLLLYTHQERLPPSMRVALDDRGCRDS